MLIATPLTTWAANHALNWGPAGPVIARAQLCWGNRVCFNWRRFPTRRRVLILLCLVPSRLVSSLNNTNQAAVHRPPTPLLPHTLNSHIREKPVHHENLIAPALPSRTRHHHDAAKKGARHQRLRAQAPRKHRQQQCHPERYQHYRRQDHPQTRPAQAQAAQRAPRQARARQARGPPSDAPEQPPRRARCRLGRAQAQVRGRGRGRGREGKGQEDARQRGPQPRGYPGRGAQVGGRTRRAGGAKGALREGGTAGSQDVYRQRCKWHGG